MIIMIIMNIMILIPLEAFRKKREEVVAEAPLVVQSCISVCIMIIVIVIVIVIAIIIIIIIRVLVLVRAT